MTRHEVNPQAPRMNAYLMSEREKKGLVIPRSDTHAGRESVGQPVEIDIKSTPVARFHREACLVACAAQEVSDAQTTVSVCRYDASTQKYKTYKYDVWSGLAKHPRLDDMIAASDTKVSPDLMDYLAEHEFWFRKKHDSEHHLDCPPEHVKYVLREREESQQAI